MSSHNICSTKWKPLILSASVNKCIKTESSRTYLCWNQTEMTFRSFKEFDETGTRDETGVAIVDEPHRYLEIEKKSKISLDRQNIF